jgi:hypothetical protein
VSSEAVPLCEQRAGGLLVGPNVMFVVAGW